MLEIDLGVLGESGPPPNAGPRFFRRPPTDRHTAAVALLGLVLATVAGAAPCRSPLVEVVTRGLDLGADFALTADRLYVTGQSLAAYRLPGGRLLWTARPAPTRGTTVLTVPAGDVVLTGVVGRDGLEGVWTTTSAVDADTGRIRWTAQGLVRPVAAGSGVAVTQPPMMSALDLATGRELWREYAPGGGFAALTGGRGVLVHLDGRAELRDMRSGRVLRRMRLLSAGQQLIGPVVRGGDGLLVLPYGGSAGTGFAAYDAATLHRRWSRPRALGSEVTACGDQLCVTDTSTTFALDPETGARRWQIPWRWSLSVAIPGGAAVLWRTADDGERGWLARLAPDGALRILESFPYRLSDCQQTPTTIACRAAPGAVRAWSFRD